MILNIPVIPTLALISFIVLLGFIGDVIFKKTNVPSMIWLMLFGLLVGPIFGLLDINVIELLTQFAALFSTLAVIIILFDGGINMDLYKLFKGAPRGLLLSVSTFVLSVFAVALILVFFGFRTIDAFLLGSVIGGTSSPIVIPIILKTKGLRENTKIILSIESAITDAMCIVLAMAIIQLIIIEESIGGPASLGILIKELASTFSIGAMIGVSAGLIWTPLMHRVMKEKFSYVVTLSVLFLVYIITASIVGSTGGTAAGAIACFMFGIVLGNGKKIFNIIRYYHMGFEMDPRTKEYHSLMAFLIRTFFFVYLGLIVSINSVEIVILGVVLSAVLFFIRPITVALSTRGASYFRPFDKKIMTVMMPRGLAAAVLAYLPYQMLGNDIYRIFADITFVVIISTAIMSTVGFVYVMKKNSEKSIEKET
ncbi:hypothetical protein DRN74_04980 [Candidatus Micrarchaeota archaeon]|nr:MAG: hypothetical protein DRN74_04980 [Candidatus Micrarchaeota archaeon]